MPLRSTFAVPSPSTRPAFLNLRAHSLMRANLLVLASLLWSFYLSHFPHNRPTLWLIAPALCSIVGTLETIRCLRLRWSFYHGAVVLCVYMDLMAVSMILFLLLYPYMNWLTSSH